MAFSRLALPTQDSPIRELFTVEDLMSLTLPKLSPDLIMRKALISAREFLASEKSAKSVNKIVLTPRGELALIKVSRSTWTGIWNFSTGKKLVKIS
jgi:hypothetical protein